ncbi:MAG: hypothetical protein M1312_01690 [Patescibacteria group bacterium]|nr:hypothetical protein [Patescibacteria group bacterium]
MGLFSFLADLFGGKPSGGDHDFGDFGVDVDSKGDDYHVTVYGNPDRGGADERVSFDLDRDSGRASNLHSTDQSKSRE